MLTGSATRTPRWSEPLWKEKNASILKADPLIWPWHGKVVGCQPGLQGPTRLVAATDDVKLTRKIPERRRAIFTPRVGLVQQMQNTVSPPCSSDFAWPGQSACFPSLQKLETPVSTLGSSPSEIGAIPQLHCRTSAGTAAKAWIRAARAIATDNADYRLFPALPGRCFAQCSITPDFAENPGSGPQAAQVRIDFSLMWIWFRIADYPGMIGKGYAELRDLPLAGT
jgi:hypothetical protein